MNDITNFRHGHRQLRRGRSSLPGQIYLVTFTTYGRRKLRSVRTSHAEVSRVWAKAFHDHGLRQEENLAHAARYIVLNPVRSGLVRRVAEYPYWDAVWV